MVKQFRAALAAALLLVLLPACGGGEKEASVRLYAMNTVMTLTAHGPNAQAGVDAAQEVILRLESLLSVTREDSDLWAINHARGQWVSVAPETVEALSLSLSLAQETGGAFHPALYPVLRAWGFTTQQYRVPPPQELAELLALTDYAAVQLDPETGRVRVPPGVELDLGGIAKGYAADLAAAAMEECGVTSALLNLGGNVQTVGTRPDGAPWRIGVQTPEPDTASYLGVVPASDEGVVTSGGYERYFEESGVRYWHILDPETGAPARSGLASATVVGPSGARCDALSTALFVLGEEGAAKLWREKMDFEFLLVREDGSLVVSQGLEGRFAPLADGTAYEVIRP